VVGAALDGLEVVLGVVALVEDQGHVFGPVGDLAIAGDELVRQAGEGRGIGLVAGIGAVEERDVEVRGDQEGEPDDAKRGAPFLALATLGHGVSRIEGVDEGEEVGGIEENALEVEVELADELRGEIALDGDEVLSGDAVHVVPEALAGELAGLEAEQPPQHGGFEPLGNAGLAAGGDAAVEGGDEQVGADAGSAAALGDVVVDRLHQSEAPRQVIQGGQRGEVGDEGLLGSRGRGGLSGHGVDDVLGAAEVFLPDDFGFAVDALGFAGVVVGVAADAFLDEARH